MTRTAPFGFSRTVFLSHVIDADTPVFPGDPSVKIAPAPVISQDGYYLQSVTFGEQAERTGPRPRISTSVSRPPTN